MKYIILIPDGAADYPLPELGGKTPLQAARKPNLDRLVREGNCGLFKTIPDNFSNGSAVANLSILGYDPRIYFQGRGVLEAASMNVPLGENDVALRCNTICLENGNIKSHSAGHVSSEEGAALIKTLDEKLGGPEIKFHPGVSYRHLLALKNRFSPELTCYPPHDYVGKPVAELMVKAKNEGAEETARILNDLTVRSWEILKDHPVNRERVKQGKDPANSAWFWSPGRKPAMKTFQERFGIKGTVISAVDLVRGLGIYSGFDVVRVAGATGLYDTNYEGKAEAALKALADHDLVYVHVEAPDEAGHDGNLPLKIKCIEDFDARLLGRVLAGLDINNTTVAVLPDHPTPVRMRGHASDPVPFVIRRNSERPDGVSAFDEESCKSGSYGLIEGEKFIRSVLGK